MRKRGKSSYVDIQTILSKFFSLKMINLYNLILKREPFSIINEKDLGLLCNYLIEKSLPDNKSFADKNTQNPNDKILNHFRTLIGTYIIFDADLQIQIHNELQEVIKSNIIA